MTSHSAVKADAATSSVADDDPTRESESQPPDLRRVTSSSSPLTPMLTGSCRNCSRCCRLSKQSQAVLSPVGDRAPASADLFCLIRPGRHRIRLHQTVSGVVTMLLGTAILAYVEMTSVAATAIATLDDVDILNGNGNLAASQWAMTSFGEVGNRNFRQQFRGDEDVASMDDEDESISIDEGLGLEATFDQMFANVTYIAGQTAILPCSIEHLAKLKVAWLDASGLPMTLEDRRIVDDTRFSVVRPLMSAWNLQIRDVRSEDSGRYRCTINTMPSRSKVVHLQVKVPAGINDSLWKNDITIQEFANLSLTCLATGVPKPEVTWRRRKEAVPRSPFDLVHTSEDIIDTNSLPSPRCLGTEPTDVISGTTLFISNVSRDCSGIYECTAANEVPPAVTRRVKVAVEFPPQVTMPNYRISQSRGRETILECQITANPQATSTWEKDGKQIQNKDPYYIEVFPDSAIGLNFNLRVRVVDESMYGAYKCRAANALGQDEGVIHLTEEKRHRHLQEHGGAQSVNVSGYQHQQQHYVISENSRGGGDTGLSGVRGQRHGQELQRPRSTGEKGERAPSSERVVSSSMSLPSKQSVAATASMTVLAAAAATAHLLFSRSLPLLWQRWLS